MTKTVKRPTILLADDHAIMAEGLRRVLSPDFDVIGTVEDGRALVAAVARLHPDIVVADISMPLLNGIEACRRIKKSGSQSKVIFLTMHLDVNYVAEALAAGASGYVLKASAAGQLIAAIHTVLEGHTFICGEIAARMLEAHASGTGLTAGADDLTPREAEVLQLVAEGRPIKEVAQILNLSPRTAEDHKYHIRKKLGLKTAAELTAYAIKHRIVSV
jgi:DNA-binding NarL/FixJ family response regulator